MLDLNLNEFMLLWGAYGITIALSICCGYLAGYWSGWYDQFNKIKMEMKGGNKK
jgi:hypothetical protein